MGSIRAKTGRYLLRKKLRQFSRDRIYNNLGSARSIGVLFMPTQQPEMEIIKQFLNYLNEYKLQIYVLGYVNSKKIPESYLFWKGINFFSKKEVGYWSMAPKTPVATDFIDKSFDIMLDLSMRDVFELEYIVRLSKAKFKVGHFTSKHKGYDMMFELQPSTSLEEFLEYIKEYIKIVTPN